MVDLKNPLSNFQRNNGSMIASAQRAMAPAGAAIVPQYGDPLKMGAYTVSSVGLTRTDIWDERTWLGFMSRIRPVVSGLQWVLGEWVNDGEIAWGQTYEVMSELTGYKEKTLREYAYVARNIDLSIRMDKLTFAHHQLVAGYAPDDQHAWLEYALGQNWTVDELRAALKKKRTRTTDPVTVFQRRLIGLGKKIQPRDDGQRSQFAALLRKMADDIEKGK